MGTARHPGIAIRLSSCCQSLRLHAGGAGMSDQPVALYRLGDEGVVVRSIRALLQATCDLAPAAPAAPGAPGPADTAESVPSGSQLSDVYDEELARAVRAFQQRRGLIVDGVVGPQTYI